MRCATKRTSHHEGLYGEYKTFFKPHPCCFLWKHHFSFLFVILFVCTLFSLAYALWPTPSRAVRFSAPHIQLGEKEGIWLGRSGGPPQNSMPTPLVYNGPVRITAGAWRAEKGTQHSLVCLFYKPLLCSVCKVPVGFVSFNSQLIQTVYSVSTIAATLRPLHACLAELCRDK